MPVQARTRNHHNRALIRKPGERCGLARFRKYTGADNAAARSLWEQSRALDASDPAVLAYIAYTHAMDAKHNWSENRAASLARAGEIAAEVAPLDDRSFIFSLRRSRQPLSDDDDV